MERFRPRLPTKRETLLAAGLAGLVGVAGHIANSETGEPTNADGITNQQPDNKPGGTVEPNTRPTSTVESDHTIPDHETYRQHMGDEVLRRLSDLDPNFSISTTVEVNGRPVADKFFGINYQMPDGNHAPLASIFPNEQTGELQLNPDEELSRWIADKAGSELNGLSTTHLEEITEAVADLAELNDLMREEKSGHVVSMNAVDEQLMNNRTITTQEAKEEQERQAADTGE